MKYFFAVLAIALIPEPGRTIEVATSNVAITEAKDLTLQPGASGEDVVDACIQKIGNVPGLVFGNDFGFLKRVALIESNFGMDGVSNNNPTGGIWQITTAIHETIINALGSISNDLIAIATVLGQEVVDFTANDYRIPLKSAIGARIYIRQRSSGNVPGSLEDQAIWWATNYNPSGNRLDFINGVERFEDTTRCKVSKLDLWFLIDGSGSIGQSDFTTCLEFVNYTAAAFSILPDRVRTGLMIYSSDTVLRSQFNDHQSNANFSKVVLETNYPSGGTATGAAITKVREDGFNVATGARPPTEAVPRILIVLTDGKSGDDVAQPSDEIKQVGVTVFGVGVGTGFDDTEIKEIASDPDSDYAFEFTQFDALTEVLQGRVATQACTVPAVVPDNTTVSVTVEARSTIYSQVALPNNGSVELIFELTFQASVAVVYLSDSVANPSSALFDVSFQVNTGITIVVVNSAEAEDSPGLGGQRRKRATSEEAQPLYVAFESQSSTPVDLMLTATQSNVRAAADSATVARSLKLATLIFALCSIWCSF